MESTWHGDNPENIFGSSLLSGFSEPSWDFDDGIFGSAVKTGIDIVQKKVNVESKPKGNIKEIRIAGVGDPSKELKDNLKTALDIIKSKQWSASEKKALEKGFGLVMTEKDSWDGTKSIDLLAAIRNQPVKDITLPGMDQGTVGILAGTGGVGKSFLILQILLYLSTGLDSLGISRRAQWNALKRRKCLYLCFEDRARHVFERLWSIGRKLSTSGGGEFRQDQVEAQIASGAFRIETLTGLRTPNFLSAEWEMWLHDIIEAGGFELVVVDTTRKSWQGNENDSGEVSALLAVFDNLSIRFGVSVLLTVHTNKWAAANGQADSAAATRGSSAFNDNGRSNFYLRGMTKEEAAGDRENGGQLWDLDRGIPITSHSGDDDSVSPCRRYVAFGSTKSSYGEDPGVLWFRRQSGEDIGASNYFGGTLEAVIVAPQGRRHPSLANFPDAGKSRESVGRYKGREIRV